MCKFVETVARPDSGSFRDPSGQIFIAGDRVFRVIHPCALEQWKEFAGGVLFRELQSARLIAASQPATGIPPDLTSYVQEGKVIEHERIPFVSYPYEWSYEMLRQAALLHLELMERSLEHDFILKDASAFNVQFVGPDPIFIDLLSFVRWRRGDPWSGYSQFCRMFLYPLLLFAYKQVPFHGLLRSELEGLDSVQFSRLMSFRDLFRKGVLAHVHLQAWMQRRFGASQVSTREAVRSTGLSKAAILNNLRSLRRVLLGLREPRESLNWSGYEATHGYSESDLSRKKDFV